MILKYPRIAKILGNDSVRAGREGWYSPKSLEQRSSLYPSMPLRTETTLKIQICMLIYLSGDSATFKIWIVFNSSGLRAQWVRVLAVWFWGPEFRPPAPTYKEAWWFVPVPLALWLAETGGSLRRVGCQPSTQVQEESLLQENKPESDIVGHPVCTSDLHVGTWVCIPSHV